MTKFLLKVLYGIHITIKTHNSEFFMLKYLLRHNLLDEDMQLSGEVNLDFILSFNRQVEPRKVGPVFYPE